MIRSLEEMVTILSKPAERMATTYMVEPVTISSREPTVLMTSLEDQETTLLKERTVMTNFGVKKAMTSSKVVLGR